MELEDGAPTHTLERKMGIKLAEQQLLREGQQGLSVSCPANIHIGCLHESQSHSRGSIVDRGEVSTTMVSLECCATLEL